ncbi:hypothetical protein L1280_000249 [Deinococcus sp. HSC-46F16]|uniref:hypothetical protein n=1 Tax=Deinococcus sp. HSC-46F16 TaxID=2910968 RepID=UPI0020A0CC95|nr:hypothetical protein [Deinococcus sp. HSC-46F16]MCP2013121.1 hypothetical protein [Deinococcus sp. HSC-46F16]
MVPHLPPALADLLAYFGPLASGQEEVAGGVALHTPGTNVLALNAVFLPDAESHRLCGAAEWQKARGRPPLVAVEESTGGEEVASFHVGTYQAGPSASPFTVEQVSRLHLPQWAAVLAEAHGTPDWAGALSRHLAGRLEERRDYALLLAYAGEEAVGALLWQAAGVGGRAHLWGTLDPAVDRALLDGAAALGAPLFVSLPSGSPAQLADTPEVAFFLMKGDGNS